MIGPGDCRITTRYNPHDFGDAFFSTLHEVGHGLYEQAAGPVGVRPAGRRSRRRWAPTNRRPDCGRTPSAVVSPSGSTFSRWPVRRSRRRLGDAGLAEFHFAVNGGLVDQAATSLIRVRADEVTYDLHILARFRLERARSRAI